MKGCSASARFKTSFSFKQFNSPVLAFSINGSPSFSFDKIPLSDASGDKCIAAGTLPEAPDILPSVTNATL